jgi:hypothetical protein
MRGRPARTTTPRWHFDNYNQEKENASARLRGYFQVFFLSVY